MLFDFLFPRKSLLGAEGAFITPEELLRLRLFPSCDDAAVLRGRGICSLDAIRAAMPYTADPLLRSAVHTLKYRRIPQLAEALGALMHHGLPPHPAGAVICPVPLHWTRRFWRGFNQAELLARALGARRGIPVCRLLMRVRPTGSQVGRARDARLRALAGAFAVCRRVPLPPRVILVDDLATTGATLDACAAVLKAGGARHVEGWVLARG